MGTLGSALNIAVQAMLTQQRALGTTTNNIANANTPGYSRQTAEMVEAPPVQYGGQLLGNGVAIDRIVSQRDGVLQLRLEQETQQESKYNSFLSVMQQVQTQFNETSGNGLQSSITAFFNSFTQLAAKPSDTNLRQAVLTAARNMVRAFNASSSNLATLQTNIDRSVSQSVGQINDLTTQIAKLNSQVSEAQVIGQNPGTFIDQRDQLIGRLSGLIDASVVDAGNGSVTLTTSGGASLVVGNQSFELATQADPATGLQHVYSSGSDITASINGGSLAGAIEVRDKTIPSIVSSLDALASNLASSVNAVSQAGFDLDGAPGGNFFAPPPTTGAGAAASISVAISDPRKIAGSQDGTAGDNSNINAILALQNQPSVNGETPLNAYASLVFRIGNDVASAQSESQGAQAMVQQLQNLIGSVSGVSLNEEAANLVRFERAYQAAAQVAAIINSLTLTAIQFGSAASAS